MSHRQAPTQTTQTTIFQPMGMQIIWKWKIKRQNEIKKKLVINSLNSSVAASVFTAISLWIFSRLLNHFCDPRFETQATKMFGYKLLYTELFENFTRKRYWIMSNGTKTHESLVILLKLISELIIMLFTFIFFKLFISFLSLIKAFIIRQRTMNCVYIVSFCFGLHVLSYPKFQRYAKNDKMTKRA